MARVVNPRHPDHCVVYRIVNEDEFTEGTKEVLYDGICRKYTTRSARTSAETVSSQYTLSIPAAVAARAGDRINVNARTGYFEGTVTEVNINNIGDGKGGVRYGTDIYWVNYKK